MLDFPRWKVILIWLALLAGVALAIPSLMPDRVASQFGIAGLPRINFGLDLQGGSHLLLEADTVDLAKQNLQKMEDTIRTEMRRGDTKIAIGDISTSNGHLSFFVRDVGCCCWVSMIGTDSLHPTPCRRPVDRTRVTTCSNSARARMPQRVLPGVLNPIAATRRAD